MAGVNQTTEFTRKFVAKFGAEYAGLLTPSEMIDLCLNWASSWHTIRTRNIVTLLRDQIGNTAWVKSDFVNHGYENMVYRLNISAHSYDLRGDLLLVPIDNHRNTLGEPALRKLYDKVYFMPKQDLFDLYHYTRDKWPLTGRPTEASKLFCYIANYLDEWFDWREDVRGFLSVYSLGPEIRQELRVLDEAMRGAIGVMSRAIRERRERGSGTGANSMQATWHWNHLHNALRNVNQEVTDITVRYNLVSQIRVIRHDTIRKALWRLFQCQVEMLQVPDMPSLVRPQPLAPAPEPSVEPAEPPPASSLKSGGGSGVKVLNGWGTKKQSDSRKASASSNPEASNSGSQGGGGSRSSSNPWKNDNDDNNNNTSGGSAAPQASGYGGYAGGLGRRRKIPSEGELRRAHWWSEDLDAQDYEATGFKKRRTSGF